MDKTFLYNFIKRQTLAVISSVSTDNPDSPESALIGIAVTNDLEIIFDTVKSSRKYLNIVQNPKVSLVIGWDNETSVQFEGIAHELNGADDEVREVYFSTFPDGRQRAETWPGLVHFIIKPVWIRYSNFNHPQQIDELIF